MEPRIKWKLNTMPKGDGKELEIMALENVAKARAFHESFPQYAVTPLAKLDKMADFLGLGTLCVKDESYRFGLNAFKVLGGSFAMAKYIAGQLGKDVSEMTYAYLTGDDLKKDFGQATFVTATDGNHGRGVAWAANKLGQKAIVHMPKGSSKFRFDNIAKEGAKVTIEEVNYDECVRIAAARSRRSPAISSYPVPTRRTDRGCRIPCSRMESASSARASGRKTCRGWSGLARMTFTGRNTTRPVSI